MTNFLEIDVDKLSLRSNPRPGLHRPFFDSKTILPIIDDTVSFIIQALKNTLNSGPFSRRHGDRRRKLGWHWKCSLWSACWKQKEAFSEYERWEHATKQCTFSSANRQNQTFVDCSLFEYSFSWNQVCWKPAFAFRTGRKQFYGFNKRF